MSIPPQLICVKRKRVEETPVTFLQFDQDSKRHRSGHNWAYQRREATSQQPVRESKSIQPIIHVSKPDDAPSSKKRKDAADTSQKPQQRSSATTGLLEPRRFHVSRTKGSSQAPGSGGDSKKKKKNRYSSAVFVESPRKKMTPKTRRSLTPERLSAQIDSGTTTREATPEEYRVEQKQLKRPGIASRARSAATEPQASYRTPLPDSFRNRQNEDMEKITNDMNQWVLSELGANLRSMEEHGKQPSRFKPKSPAKRFYERHPELAAPTSHTTLTNSTMSNVSDDDDDDDDNDDEWVIEEYVRIPAHSVALNVLATDVGILVLDEEEENMLFFGSTLDEDDEHAEDDEDENAENHYTADYPEDEMGTDDELNHPAAHLLCHGNNSDEEEFDETFYDERDEMALEGDVDDDDAKMARIREFMKRNSAFR